MASVCTDQFTFLDVQLYTHLRTFSSEHHNISRYCVRVPTESDIIHEGIVKSEVVEIKRGCIVKQKSKEPSGSPCCGPSLERNLNLLN